MYQIKSFNDGVLGERWVVCAQDRFGRYPVSGSFRSLEAAQASLSMWQRLDASWDDLEQVIHEGVRRSDPMARLLDAIMEEEGFA